MIKKILISVTYYCSFLINIFTKPKPVFIPDSLLLIRLDGIGDYLLFRNFIKSIKHSRRYRRHKITLLGNIAWKDLFETLDKEDIDTCIWLDQKKFNMNPMYRHRKLNQIRSVCYETVLSPVLSRDFEFTDYIVNLSCAKEKIGSAGDLSNIKNRQKKMSDLYYTDLIPVSPGPVFEFYRNKEFLEIHLGIKIDLKKPDIRPKSGTGCQIIPPKKYAVLFIGGKGGFKQWPMAHFSKAGAFIHETYDLKIVLCGGPGEKGNAGAFSRIFPFDFLNLVGRTSLTDLLHIIKGSSLMVSNETFAPHVAAALDIPHIFVIYNGNHFGRFTPYPKNITKGYHLVSHPKIETDTEAYKQICMQEGYESLLKIKDIAPAVLIDKIKKSMAGCTGC